MAKPRTRREMRVKEGILATSAIDIASISVVNLLEALRERRSANSNPRIEVSGPRIRMSSATQLAKDSSIDPHLRIEEGCG